MDNGYLIHTCISNVFDVVIKQIALPVSCELT